jgi:hypothetical protein
LRRRVGARHGGDPEDPRRDRPTPLRRAAGTLRAAHHSSDAVSLLHFSAPRGTPASRSSCSRCSRMPPPSRESQRARVPQRRVTSSTRRGDGSGSSDRTWIFSFLNVCDALGLDAQYIRRGLQELRGRRPPVGN